ncbi:MAG TPA: exopolyphosphatase, partial [Magnetovibrio sp.]
MSEDKKYRLVTRADFDGVVAGGLLIELGLVDDVLFAEPKAMQDGLVKITGNDITTNLPYVEGVHLCFDHHVSETERIGERENHIISPTAPSAARVVYDYFGGKEKFPSIPDDLMEAVDKADSAQFNEEDILAPDPWTMLNFILDPRTGLSRFEHFE